MTVNDRTLTKARPVLKWAGGKGRLLPELLKSVPDSFAAYHEPFVGGGALFFELANQGRLMTAYLSDVNPSLIDVYVGLRDCVDEVIALLRQHQHDKAYYYQLRALNPKHLSLPERAARVLYLNKTCYNGLYRENSAGQFNVPFGRYKNPVICDEPNLRAASRLLQGVSIERRHFSSVLDVARSGDFVYFDPPYHPLSPTSNFTSYDRNGFRVQDQAQLRDLFKALTDKGVYVLLSNSDTPLIRKLYRGYAVSRVFVPRAINSKGDSRGKVAEVIVSSQVKQKAPSS